MMSLEQDHYGVLELEPGSPMEDVKSQYRRLAKLCHPDLHGDDARCAEQFRRVNAAYTFLSDAPRKAAYDAVLQAARKAGAPPLRPVPPLKSSPPPAATGRQVPVAGGGLREGPGDGVRMTRSAWLGATAGAVVVLLVVGLSLDGSGPRRPASFGGPSSTPTANASGAPPDDGRGGGSGLDADADPAAFPVAPPADADAAPAPAPRLRAPIPLTAPPHPGVVGGLWTAPRAVPTNPAGRVFSEAVPAEAVPADADPAEALRRRLLARYHAALPRADRLLARGSAVVRETEDGGRRLLREQLAADLADLSAARARLRPALARLPERDTPEQVLREAGPLLTGLRRLEDAGSPVRSDIKALAADTAGPRPPRVAFHFGPLAPMRSEAPPPAPSPDPAPAMASVVPPPPRTPDTPALGSAVKPKMQADPRHEFILWNNK